MKKILFQGDSITDAFRLREHDFSLGQGYATMVAGKICEDFPGQYTFFNRGISGNRVTDMYTRIKADVLNIKPDYMTVLIGVNDCWHDIAWDNGVSADKFEKIYTMFIEEIKAELPDIKIVMMLPYIMPGKETTEKWEDFKREVTLRAEKSRAVAEKFNIPYVELQKPIEEISALAGNEYVLRDGVHPIIPGDAVIAKALYSELKKIL